MQHGPLPDDAAPEPCSHGCANAGPTDAGPANTSATDTTPDDATAHQKPNTSADPCTDVLSNASGHRLQAE